ncbi:hypothetical protein LXL04_021901 [Taraxacum kok-saghyz]
MASKNTAQITASTHLTIKLTSNNYPVWRKQVESTLISLDLDGHITSAPPATTLADKEGKTNANPEYRPWYCKDQMIFSAILGSCSDSIQPLVSSATTAREAWNRLSSSYASTSRSRIISLKSKLVKNPKGSRSITEFLQDMRAIADSLALAQSPVTEEDLMVHILSQLGDEYHTIVAALKVRENPIEYSELFDKLTDFERSLKEAFPPSDILPTTVNYTTRNQGFNNRSSSNNSYNRNTRSPPSYQSRGSQQSQWNNNNNTGGNRNTKSNQFCQFCNIPGHLTKDCRKLARFLRDNNITTDSNRTSPPTANVTTSSPGSPKWLFDTGASNHVASDPTSLHHVSEYGGPDEIVLGDGTCLPITHIGHSYIHTSHKPLILSNVLHVPKLNNNLVSVGELCDTNLVSVEFFPSHFYVKDLDTEARLMRGERTDGVYLTRSPATRSIHVTSKTSPLLLHHKLGHPSRQVFKQLVSKLGFKFQSESDVHWLKLEDLSDYFKSRSEMATSDHESHSVLQFLCEKEKRCEEKISFNLENNTVHIIPDDVHDVLHVSEENMSPDVVEGESSSSENEEVVKSESEDVHSESKSLNYESDVPSSSSNSFEGMKPYRKPVLQDLQKYETQSWNQTEDYVQKPYGVQIPKCDLHVRNTNSYLKPRNSQKKKRKRKVKKIWIPKVKNVEKVQKIVTKSVDSRKSVTSDNGGEYIGLTSYLQQHGISHYTTPPHTPEQNGIAERRHRHIVETGLALLHQTHMPLTFWSHAFQTAVYLINRLPTPILQNKSPFECLFNQSPNYHKLQPFATPTQQPPSPSNSNPPLPTVQPPPTASPLPAHRPRKPNPKYYNQSFVNSTTLHPIPNTIEPTTHTQALKDPQWRTAMDHEFNALLHNGTWELVPKSSHTPIGCKWIFRIKRNPDGSISKYKARLVAKGFLQQQGKDYFETFNPVTKPVTIRTVLSIALSSNWNIHQLDVNNAFLHGTLHEEVFMTQPPGYIHPNYPTHVCKLRKSLYGLKQAPRAWYLELTSFLVSFGFQKSKADPSLFIYKSGNIISYLLVYVDDFVLTGNNNSFLDKFVSALSNRFSIKDLGPLHHFLGVEVIPVSTGLFLSQHRHIHDLLQQFHMDGAKEVTAPLNSSVTLTLHDGSPSTDPTPYRQLVGSLKYLAFTRPDISFAVNKLSQFMHAPTDTHCQALKRVLRYLKGTIHHGLYLHKKSDFSLSAFSDSDWGGIACGGRSTTAYLLFLGSNIISWRSARQKSISRSSTEAEYKALANAASEVMWVKNLLRELGILLPHSPTLFCDNTSATYSCANPVYHSRMKHVALDYYFVREQVQDGSLHVRHVNSVDQLADALTKPLTRGPF